MHYPRYTVTGIFAVIVVFSLLSCVSTGPNSGDRQRCDGTDNGFFSIYSPASGQSVKMGSQDSIKWSNQTFSTDSIVSLFLYKGQEFVQTIKTNVKSNGMCAWSVPRLQAGNGYRIKIASRGDTTQFDYSCTFSLISNVTGSYTIISPTAGVACTSGANLQIRWQSTGTPGDSVSLELCKDTIPLVVIANATGNSGAFSWLIPKALLTKDNYRVKITSLLDPGIGALSAPFTIVGLGIDEYEPDNVRDSAKALDPLGKAQNHSLTVNDIDWVKFRADSGKGYVIEVRGDVNGYLYSLNDTTNFILQIINNTVPWTCPKTGAYYFKFTALNDSIIIYSVNVTKNDSLKAVVVLAPLASTVWNVGLSYPIQWIPDTALLGKSVNISLIKGAGLVSNLANDVPNGGSFSYNVDAKLETGSDYRIKIVNAVDTLKNGLSSAFTIQGCTSDSYEPDNRRDIASQLVINGKAQTHTLTINDTDWTGFKVDSGKAYRMRVSGTVPTSIGLFFGTASAPSADSNWSSPGVNVLTLNWQCTNGGTWYARIVPGPAASGCGGYSFEVADMESLAVVTISSPAQGAVWAAGSTQQIKWTPDTIVLSKLVDIYLFKGSQQGYKIVASAFNSGNYNWAIPSGMVTGSDYRIRISNASFSSVGHYSGIFTINGIVPDSYEPDNRRDSASTLSPLGKAQSHTLTMNDTDWVKFSADSGGIYVVQSAGYFMGIYLYFGSDNSYTTYFYNAAKGSSLTWTCTKTGTWFARIAALSNLDGAVYSFNITKFDSTSSVNILAPVQGTSWSTGSTYQIQWKPDSVFLGTTVSIYLYKGSKQLSYIAGGVNNSGVYSWYVPSGLETGSDYRVKIVNYYNARLFGLSSAFTINGIAADSYEPDNKRDSASTLSPLGKAQSHTLTMNDTDWVKFSADSGRKYILQCSGNLSTMAYIYYGSETYYTTSYFSSASSSSLKQWTCTRGGVWYARITSSSGSTYGGNYSFNVTAFDSLTAVSFASPVATSAWTTGSASTIQWTPDSAILGTYVYIQLYKGGRYLLDINYGPNSGSFAWTVPAGLATGSDYRIRISSSSNSGFGGYSPLFSITGLTPDTYEPDDSVSKASTIATDGTVQSRSLSLGDIDWIRFTATKDSLYILKAEISGTGALNSIDEFLYDSLGIAYMAFQEGTSAYIRWICPQNGTYHLAVQSNAGYYGNYAVSIKAYSSRVNVNFINPTALSIWSAGSSYSIQWTPDTALFGQYARLQLNIDTTMVQLINSSTQNRGTYSWTPPSGMVSGSNYVIKLSSYDLPMLHGYSPAFTISGVNPDSFERDDSASLAHTIATTGVSENHTLSLNDRDWYKFSANANYLYVIKTTGAASSMSTQLNLYNTDGRASMASARSTTADSSATILMFCTAAGAYYFRVSSSTTGSYQAMVAAYDSTQYGLTITKPLAGDSLTMGQADTIKWTSQVPLGGNVDIYLSDSAGVVQTIVANTPNNNSYRWTVPTSITARSDYYIRIISRTNSRFFGVSGVFKIKAN